MNCLDANRIENLVSKFCADNHLSVQVSYEMPAGYETAFGNTLSLKHSASLLATQAELPTPEK